VLDISLFFLYFFLALFSHILISLLTYLKIKEHFEKIYPPEYLSPPPPPKSYIILPFFFTPKISTPAALYELNYIGKTLDKNGISKIYLIHGTWMGDDPFGIFNCWEKLFPFIPLRIKLLVENLIKAKLNTQKEKFFGDRGQFTTHYGQFLEDSLGGSIKVKLFTWNSANHHLGRIKGALKLLEDLSNESCNKILLLGHSHAGQLMAILSRLLKRNSLDESNHDQDLLQFLINTKITHEKTKEIIELVKVKEIDFVTLGMPPRYPFYLNTKIRLLNIINHRNSGYLAGKLLGIFNTRDGDYIQQWGVTGSDTISPFKEERILNLQLNHYFDQGQDLLLWAQNLMKRKRVPDYGFSVLINFKPKRPYFNFIATIFGHGTYTEKKEIIRIFKILIRFFYA
jgi:hypothetical protein